MEILFQQQHIQIDRPTSDQIIEQINIFLNDSYYFSHFVVDGVEIYEEPVSYLSDHVNHINRLEIVAKTLKEFMNDILLSAENYLKRAVPELNILSDGFYNNPSSDHWTGFEQMLEGMQWLNQLITSIDQMKEKPFNWDNYMTLAVKLEGVLQELEGAVENADHVFVADLIQYEIKPVYEAFQQEITVTIDTEGSRHDTN